MWTVKIAGTTVDVQNLKIEKELNNLWKASFNMDNHPDNRELLKTELPDVTIDLERRRILTGKLVSPELHHDHIKCDVLDKIQYLMDRKLYTKNWGEIAVNTIMTDICSTAGVNWESDITYTRSLRFKKASCLYAAIIVALHCGMFEPPTSPLDWFTTETGIKFGIYQRERPKIDIVDIGHKRIDWQHQKDVVTVIGWKEDGTEVSVSQGTGDREYEFRDRNWRDPVSYGLEQFCTRLYLRMNKPIAHVPIKVTLETILDDDIRVGDLVTVKDLQLDLDDKFRIAKITYGDVIAGLDLVKPELGIVDELIPQIGADPQPEPALSRVAVRLPTSEIVMPAGSIPDPWENLPIVPEYWYDVDSVTVTDDTDRFYIFATLKRLKDVNKVSIRGDVYVRVTDGTNYWPNETGFKYRYDGQVSSSVIIVIPENVNGKTLTIQMFTTVPEAAYIDVECHYHGTSPHEHGLDDFRHQNIMSDKRRSLVEAR